MGHKVSAPAAAKAKYLQALRAEAEASAKSKKYGSEEIVKSCDKAITAVVAQFGFGAYACLYPQSVPWSPVETLSVRRRPEARQERPRPVPDTAGSGLHQPGGRQKQAFKLEAPPDPPK